MYTKVRYFFLLSSTAPVHRLHKITILMAFQSTGPGDFRTVFIFLRPKFLEYFDFKIRDPLLKSLKNIFFNYSRVTYQKTHIGTLNSNIEYIFRNVKKCSIDMRKAVLFGKFPNYTAFLLPVQSICKILEKWFDICVQCLNAHLLNGHKATRIFEKYKSQEKKVKTVFKSPGRGL